MELSDVSIHFDLNVLGEARVRLVMESGVQELQQYPQRCNEKRLREIVEQSRSAFLEHSMSNELTTPTDELQKKEQLATTTDGQILRHRIGTHPTS